MPLVWDLGEANIPIPRPVTVTSNINERARPLPSIAESSGGPPPSCIGWTSIAICDLLLLGDWDSTEHGFNE